MLGILVFFNISEKNKSGEIGYWISSEFTRKGYMTEAVGIIEKEVFDNFGINRISIKCDERNKASSGVAKKCGYKFEGKLREYSYNGYFKGFRNMLFYSKLVQEYFGK